jgi:hypothetical protein
MNFHALLGFEKACRRGADGAAMSAEKDRYVKHHRTRRPAWVFSPPTDQDGRTVLKTLSGESVMTREQSAQLGTDAGTHRLCIGDCETVFGEMPTEYETCRRPIARTAAHQAVPIIYNYCGSFRHPRFVANADLTHMLYG